MTVLAVRCLSTEIGKNGLIVQAVAMPNGVKADRVRVKIPCGFVFLPIPPHLGNQLGKCGGVTGLASNQY